MILYNLWWKSIEKYPSQLGDFKCGDGELFTIMIEASSHVLVNWHVKSSVRWAQHVIIQSQSCRGSKANLISSFAMRWIHEYTLWIYNRRTNHMIEKKTIPIFSHQGMRELNLINLLHAYPKIYFAPRPIEPDQPSNNNNFIIHHTLCFVYL